MVDKSRLRFNLAGRTRAFSPSNMENPMLELWYQYHEPFIDHYSISDIILGLSELSLTDSRDTVTHLEHHYLSLHPLLLLELEEAVNAFQNLLEKTVSLQPRPLFIIDPTLLLTSTLRCVGTFEELKAVWDLLSRRLHLAREWFDLRCFSSLDREFVADNSLQVQEMSEIQLETSRQAVFSATPTRVTVRGPNALMDCLGASSHRHDSLATDCLADESPEIKVEHKPDLKTTSTRPLPQNPFHAPVLTPPMSELSPNSQSKSQHHDLFFDNKISRPAGPATAVGVLGTSDGGEGNDVSNPRRRSDGDTLEVSCLTALPPLLDPGPISYPRLSSELLSSDSLLLAGLSSSDINRVITASSASLPDNRPEPARGQAEPFPDNRLGEAPIIFGIIDWNHDRNQPTSSLPRPPPFAERWTDLPDNRLFVLQQLGVSTPTAQSSSSWSKLGPYDFLVRPLKSRHPLLIASMNATGRLDSQRRTIGSTEWDLASTGLYDRPNWILPGPTLVSGLSPVLQAPGALILPNVSPPILRLQDRMRSSCSRGLEKRDLTCNSVGDKSDKLDLVGFYDRGEGNSVSKLELNSVEITRLSTVSPPPLLDLGPPSVIYASSTSLATLRRSTAPCSSRSPRAASSNKDSSRRVFLSEQGLSSSRLPPLLDPRPPLYYPSPSHLCPDSPSSTLPSSHSFGSPATRRKPQEQNPSSWTFVLFTTTFYRACGMPTSVSVDGVSRLPDAPTTVMQTRELTSSFHRPPLLDPGPSDVARLRFTFAMASYRRHPTSRNASSDNLVHVLRTSSFEGRALTADWKGAVHEVLDGLYGGGDGHAVSKVQYRGSLIDERRASLAYRGLQVSRFTLTLLRLPAPNSSFSSHSLTISSAHVLLITTIQVLVASWSVFMGLVRVRLLVQSSGLNGSKNKDWKEGLAGVSMARVSRAFVVKSRRIYAKGELLLTSSNNFQLDRFLDTPWSPLLDPGPMVSESQFTLATFLYVLQLLVLLGTTSCDRSQPQATYYTRANLSNPLAYGARVANTNDEILAEMRLILVRGPAEPYTEVRSAGATSAEGFQVVFRHPEVTRVQAHVTVPSHRPCLLNLRPHSSSQLVIRPSPMSFRLQVPPASSVPSPDNRFDLARGHVEPFPDNRLGYALTVIVRSGNFGTRQREGWMSNICPETGLMILLLNSRPRFCLHLQSRRLLGLNTMRPRQTSSNNGEKGATVKDQGLCDGGDGLLVRKTHSQGLIVKCPLFLSLRHPPLLDPGPLPSVYSLPLRSPVPPHSLGFSLDISFTSPTSWIPRTSDVPTPAVMVMGVLRSLAALLLVAREYVPFICAGVDSNPAYALDERPSQRMEPASLRGSDSRVTQRLPVLLFHCLPRYYLSLNVAILPSLSFADALPQWPSTSGLTKFVMDGSVSRSLDTSSSVVRAPPSPFLLCLSPLFNPESNSPLPLDIAASALLNTSIYVVEFLQMVDVLSSVICVRVWSHARCLHDLGEIHSNRGLRHGGLELKGMYSAADGCKIYLCYIKPLMNGIWALPPNQLLIYAVLSRVGGATTYPSHFTSLLCRSGFSRTFLLGGKGGIGISSPFRGQRTILWSLRKIDIQRGYSAVYRRDPLSGSQSRSPVISLPRARGRLQGFSYTVLVWWKMESWSLK